MIYKRSNLFWKCGCSVKIYRTTTEFQRVARRLMVLIYDLSTFCILKKILKDCIHYKLILSTHFAPPLFSYPLKTSKKPFKCFHGVKKTRSMKWVSLTIIQKYMGYLSPVIHKLTDFG